MYIDIDIRGYDETYIKVNDEFVDKGEALQILERLVERSNELISAINSLK